MTRTVFDNAMVAHVWAQRTQDSGKSGNGNFYFEGPFLYSYGSHFLVGYALPDGRALLNASRYSMSTNRQQSDAARAVRGRAVSVPNLTEFRDVLAGHERDVQGTWGPTPDQLAENNVRLLARALAMITRDAPKVAKGQSVNPRAVPTFPHFGQDAAAMILEALGLPAEKAAKTAAKALKTRESNCAKWKAAIEAAKLQAKLDLAKKTAATPLSESAKALAGFERSGRMNARLHVPQYEAWAREVFAAAKAAKAKGWTGIAAACMTHYRLIRERVAKWPELEGPAEVRAELRQAFAVIRLARSYVAMTPRELGAAEAGEAWNRKPVRLFIDARETLRSLGLINGDKPANRNWTQALCRYMRVAGIKTEGPYPAEPFAAELVSMAERAERAEQRGVIRGQLADLRAFREALVSDPAAVPFDVVESAYRSACNACNTWGRGDLAKLSGPWAAGGWSLESLRQHREIVKASFDCAKARDTAEKEAATLAYVEARAAAWIAGQPEPERPDAIGGSRGYGGRLEDSEGGALIRARSVTRDESGMITGGTLETSQGAEVPLTHAIRAFRFLKLCRDKGQGWQANGKTLPVGHFKVDHVDSEGNFRAGCHQINWGEVARLAAELGLDHLAPENTTEPTQGVHA